MRIASSLGVALVLIASTSFAKVGVYDDEPAATLLIPYVEVDLASPTGRTTVVNVRAARAGASLAHVTLWTDQGLPVLGFDIYLTGFDAVTFDLRDVLNGTLPATASAGQDPGDTISKKGSMSQDINFNSCSGVLPPMPLSATVAAGARNAMTGQASTSLQGKCGGRAIGDNVARGFLTIDSTNSCTQLLPNQPNYFGVVASNRNELTGHFALADRANKTTRAFSAVHLQAISSGPYVSGSTAYTFYSRLTGNFADQREPLGTSWSVPYRAGASIIAWRDVNWPASSYDCGQGPAPVGQTSLFLFDQQEAATDVGSLTPFPVMASRVRVGSPELPDTNRAGLVNFGGSLGMGQPRQLWLGSMETAEAGEFASALVGTQADNAALPNLGSPGQPQANEYPVTAMSTMDRSPAATLLLPYFEVDLDDPNRSNTVVRVGTAAASAVLVNVTFWTDVGVPTRSFPVYLTGYDQAELNLRVLFTGGAFHRTASAGQDPGDTNSPKGPFSQDINWGSCSGRLPVARLKTDELKALVDSHLGKPVATLQGKCVGTDRSDRVVRGYMTFDQVTACPNLPASAPSYPDLLDSRNLLSGDWAITNRTQKTMYGESLVPLHARNGYAPAGTPTFYGRSRGWNATDRREALPTTWEVPFDETGSGKTSLIVWREPDAVTPFTCGTTPPGQPSAHGSAVAFDDQEQASMITGTPFSRVSTFIAVGAGGLDVPYQRGFVQLDLQGGTGGPPNSAALRGGVVLAVRRDSMDGTGWVQNGHPVPPDMFYAPSAAVLVELSQPDGFFKGLAGSATFRVRATRSPTADVTFTLTGSGMTVTPSTVTLNASNYNTGVTVTATAAMTVCNFPGDAFIVSSSVTSTDSNFSGFNPGDVTVPCAP